MNRLVVLSGVAFLLLFLTLFLLKINKCMKMTLSALSARKSRAG